MGINKHQNADDQADRRTQDDTIRQPLSPEQVSPEQRAENQQIMDEQHPTVNPGDQVNREKSLAEKAQQVAVNTGDITGDRIVVPTYFVVDDPEEGKKALHHVKDAEAISDVIRQARTDESGDRQWW